jgi:hypothetical protein
MVNNIKMNNINCGFVTFATEDWLPLLEVLVDSIKEFSKFKIKINTINFDYNFNSDKVITEKIDLKNVNRMNIHAQKWIGLKNNPFDYCLILDCDMIATSEIDNIFYKNYEKLNTINYPLFARHPHNPFKNPENEEHLKNFISLFTENTPKINYIFANCVFNTKKHMWFIDDIIWNLEYAIQNDIWFYAEDEGLVNALATKHSFTEDIGYNYFPWYECYVDYIKNLRFGNHVMENYISNNCPIEYYLFHGCKNYLDAKNILEKLKNKL